MRDCREYFKDHDEYLEVIGAHDRGWKVICIPHSPELVVAIMNDDRPRPEKVKREARNQIHECVLGLDWFDETEHISRNRQRDRSEIAMVTIENVMLDLFKTYAERGAPWHSDPENDMHLGAVKRRFLEDNISNMSCKVDCL